MDAQTIYDNLDKQILKALKAVENSQKKGPTTRPSLAEATNQEPSCFKKEPFFQKPETDQPIICKGMNKTSNSNMCADEIFMCHGREDDAIANPMVLEKSAESNTKEQEEAAFETIQSPKEEKPEKTQRTLPLISNLEITTSHESEPIPNSLSYDLQKHCKEIGVINTLPSLFVLVTHEEEKRFGLENVKEFCVSGFAFDQMIKSFETLRHEEFSRQKDSLFSEICDSNFALSHKLFRKTFENELIGNNKDFVIDERFSKVENFTLLSRKELHNSKSYRENHVNSGCEDFWVLKFNETNSFWKKNVFESFSKLDQDFAWFERVLPECKTKCALKEWWFYLSMNLKYPFIHDPTDIICLSLSKEPNAGCGAGLKRKKRSQMGEEDERFKPPDLDQDKHQDINIFILIKQAPPDATHKIGGNFVILQNSVSANLFFVHADGSDLRTNPFQVGGDDMILASTKEMGHEPEHEDKKQGAMNYWRVLIGLMTKVRTMKLKEVIRGMLMNLAHPEASPHVHTSSRPKEFQ